MGLDGMGLDGMGWDGIRWHEMGAGRVSCTHTMQKGLEEIEFDRNGMERDGTG